MSSGWSLPGLRAQEWRIGPDSGHASGPRVPPKNRTSLFIVGSALNRHRSAYRTARRAQAITELALVLPLLAVILVGVADLGRAFYQTISLHEAVQAGALASLDSSRFPDCTRATPAVLTAIKLAPTGIDILDG